MISLGWQPWVRCLPSVMVSHRPPSSSFRGVPGWPYRRLLRTHRASAVCNNLVIKLAVLQFDRYPFSQSVATNYRRSALSSVGQASDHEKLRESDYFSKLLPIILSPDRSELIRRRIHGVADHVRLNRKKHDMIRKWLHEGFTIIAWLDRQSARELAPVIRNIAAFMKNTSCILLFFDTIQNPHSFYYFSIIYKTPITQGWVKELFNLIDSYWHSCYKRNAGIKQESSKYGRLFIPHALLTMSCAKVEGGGWRDEYSYFTRQSSPSELSNSNQYRNYMTFQNLLKLNHFPIALNTKKKENTPHHPILLVQLFGPVHVTDCVLKNGGA